MTELLAYPSEAVPAHGATALEALRVTIEQGLAVASVEVPRESRTEGVLVLRGRLLAPSHELFPRWLAAGKAQGYTPFLQPLENADDDEVVVRIFDGVARPGRSNVWINGVLFAVTVLSALFVGMLYGDNGLVLDSAWDLLNPMNLIKGWPFAATMLGILAAHEFGHYFAARYHKVAVTLPYFIPLPVLFGTLGAFIQLKEPVPDRRKLFDIGVAGPLAGIVLAVPLLIYGLATSPVLVPPPMPGAIVEGNSIFYYLAKLALFGKVLPNPITGEDVMMNQVAFAAWGGLLVTALNLMPVGQLDGGHTVFAMFGRKARIVNLATVGVMALLAVASIPPLQAWLPILGSIGFTGWFLWLFLIVFVIGVEHPPALDDVTRLDRRRRWLGFLVILLFILLFVPVPMREL